MSAWYDSIYGRIAIDWTRDADRVVFSARIPDGIPGRVELPDGTIQAFRNAININWKG